MALHLLDFRHRGILDVGAFEGTFARTARHFFAPSPILMLEARPGTEVDCKPSPRSCRKVDQRIVVLGAENRAGNDLAAHAQGAILLRLLSVARSLLPADRQLTG